MKKTYGPGPGAYLLPPTVGYANHDPSRWRNPQYSFRGVKRGTEFKTLGVGPTYTVSGFTQHGKITTPAYTLKFRQKDLQTFKPPGPGTYSPQQPKIMPAYSIRSRPITTLKSITPGPDRYLLPSTIGHRVPDKVCNPGYSMAGKHSLSSKQQSPGPAKYAGLNLDAIIPKNPSYSMTGRNFMPTNKTMSPGPAAYIPHLPKKGTGGFQFGVKTDMEPYITAADDMPCVSR